MRKRILRPCVVCRRPYQASYLVERSPWGAGYYCIDCWRRLHAAFPELLDRAGQRPAAPDAPAEGGRARPPGPAPGEKEHTVDIESADKLLTTTRSVRRRLDLSRPVEPEVIERCLAVAAQAPSGSDRQKWHFVVVTDPAKRLGLAELYRSSFAEYAGPGASSATAVSPLAASAIYLAEHFHEVPVLVLFCYEGRAEQDGVMGQAGLYGSILPAAWSFMLALRARGLGSAWTTLHLRYEREAAELLGLPDTLTQAALIPVAYATGGDFRPAKRRPVQEVTHWNGWGRRREE